MSTYLYCIYLHTYAGVVEFNFSKVQEASIPISGTFQLLLGDSSTTSLVYGATALEVCRHFHATWADINYVVNACDCKTSVSGT